MARINDTANVLAFLDMLAWSEGTAGRGDDGYNKVVNGKDSPNFFNSYEDHPRILVTVNSKGLKSSAAGRYQFLSKDWTHYKDLLNLPDFGPISQDKWAIQLIRERGAIDDIKAGCIVLPIRKCSIIWASLPGAGYGQPEHSLDKLIAKYVQCGGETNDH